MLKKYRVILVILSCIFLYLILNSGNIPVSVEDVAIPSGISFDLKVDDRGHKHYLTGISIYTFNKKDEVNFIPISGIGENLPKTREARQLKSNHKLLFGLEKAIIYSEDTAKIGIGTSLDLLFSNEYISDMGWMVICKGEAYDILKFKVDGYPTSTDYIEGMMEASKEQNFFSDNYKIIDAYVRVDAEGRSLVLPYIENQNNVLQITGVALFKKDKMVQKLSIYDTKIMNMLRESDVRGVLTLQNDFNKLIALYGKVKRKVSCKKIGDKKFSFKIDLKYTGEVINDTIYKDFLKEPKSINKFEKVLARNTEKICYKFINKMQKEYKVDCLELGRVAAAKYGRDTGVDWDKIVSNSDIKVNVKIKVDKLGRGQYQIEEK